MFNFMKNRQKGSVFTVLLAGVAMAGTLSVILYQVISGPMASVVRVSNKTAAKNQLQSISNIVIMDAINLTDNGGDCDLDTFVEPREWRDAGTINHPSGGGLIPNNIGAPLTDPWGSDYGYCVWDVGTHNDPTAGIEECKVDANRLIGNPDPTDTDFGDVDTQTVLAIISAGPDRKFQTTCVDYDVNNPQAILNLGGDDFIQRYTYTEAATATSSLWRIKTDDPNIAEIDKNITVGTPDVGTDDPMKDITSGVIRALAVITEGMVKVGGPLRLALTEPADFPACTEANKGDVRYNNDKGRIESCNGEKWKASVSGDFVEGAVPFANAEGELAQDNNDPNNTPDDFTDDTLNFSWDTTNKELSMPKVKVTDKALFVGQGGEKPIINNPLIDDIANVVITSPAENHVLRYIGGMWQNQMLDPNTWSTTGNNIYRLIGNVGIGTDTPGANLSIDDPTSASLSVRADNDINGGVSIIDDTNYPRIYGPKNEVFCLGVTGDTVCTGLTLKPGGNVGIGTNDPMQKLQVNGNVYINNGESATLYSSMHNMFFSGVGYAHKNYIFQGLAGQSGQTWGGITIRNGQTDGTYISKFQFSGGYDVAYKTGSLSWASFSDKRLKKDINYIESASALSKLTKLNAASFNWINPRLHAEGLQYGFIAQDVQKLFPSWVKEYEAQNEDKELVNKDGKALMLDLPSEFDAYIVESIKELAKQNKELRAEIEELKKLVKESK